jgi:hypothetical protein
MMKSMEIKNHGEIGIDDDTLPSFLLDPRGSNYVKERK